MVIRYFFSILILLVFFVSVATAQSLSIAGTVTDANNNEPLIGATVTVESSTQGSVTDMDGKYSIDNMPAGTYTLKVSYVGYDSKQISGVEVKSSQVTTMNITLDVSKTNTLLEVVVTAEARMENISSMLVARKNSAVVSDAISAEMIKRSPDKSTSDVLKRVSGVTIQDNKFVVVRGMNDRYNSAMLNGSLLPSSEPDRKTFAFDIFPASVVDNITIIKSVTPDLPGDFSGGLVQINTKEIPDKNFISAKVGAGYNSISTFKPYYTYHGGKTDWLGIDDGTRALPSGFPAHDTMIHLPDASSALVAAGQSLQNNWAYTRQSSSPLNQSLEITGGFKTSKKSYPAFGGIMGITYNTSRKLLPSKKYDYYNHSEGADDTFYKYNDSAFTRSILTSALADFALKIDANNKISFNNIYSINSTDQTVLRDGFNAIQGWFLKANSFYFTSNKILNSQLGGEHFIPGIKLKIKWQGYNTTLNRDEPDYRRNYYFRYDESTPFYALVSSSPSSSIYAGTHYYGSIVDHAHGANIDLSEPFQLLKQTQSLKFGGAYYHDQRTRDVRVLSNIESNSDNFSYLTSSQDTIYAPSHFNSTNGFYLYEDPTAANHYDGSISNSSGYLMLDNKFSNKVRLVWGVRAENYHSILNSFYQTSGSLRLDTTYLDFLPSANLILSVLKNANLRFSYSRTVARPSYRELAPTLFYDFLQNITYNGNPSLVETHITNYEVRWEHYFSNAQYYSVSFFYKKFINPIEEKIPFPGSDSRTLSWVNSPQATNVGVEIEGRKNFGFIGKGWENLYAYINLALIKSKVTSKTVQSPDSSATRPLQGQSPFVLNAALQYTDPKSGFGISALCNYIGHRLAQVGDQIDEPIWQEVHPTLDLKVSKAFLNNGLVEITWSDILHGNDVLYEDLDRNGTFESAQPSVYTKGDRVIELQHNGFNLSFAVSYKF